MHLRRHRARGLSHRALRILRCGATTTFIIFRASGPFVDAKVTYCPWPRLCAGALRRSVQRKGRDVLIEQDRCLLRIGTGGPAHQQRDLEIRRHVVGAPRIRVQQAVEDREGGRYAAAHQVSFEIRARGTAAEVGCLRVPRDLLQQQNRPDQAVIVAVLAFLSLRLTLSDTVPIVSMSVD